MKTERLFDKDAFLFTFEAQVLSCEKQGKYFAAVLNKTAFFPEGGGQPADKGTLGGEPVCDVQEKEGIIYHYMKAPLAGTVQGYSIAIPAFAVCKTIRGNMWYRALFTA